ncbi:unnamed protein product, partial [Didymodactylos carnosus]
MDEIDGINPLPTTIAINQKIGHSRTLKNTDNNSPVLPKFDLAFDLALDLTTVDGSEEGSEEGIVMREWLKENNGQYAETIATCQEQVLIQEKVIPARTIETYAPIDTNSTITFIEPNGNTPTCFASSRETKRVEGDIRQTTLLVLPKHGKEGDNKLAQPGVIVRKQALGLALQKDE